MRRAPPTLEDAVEDALFSTEYLGDADAEGGAERTERLARRAAAIAHCVFTASVAHWGRDARTAHRAAHLAELVTQWRESHARGRLPLADLIERVLELAPSAAWQW